MIKPGSLKLQLLLVMILFCWSAIQAFAEAGGARSKSAVVFMNVNVVPMDRERIIPAQTVIIYKGIITAVGPADKVPVPRHGVLIDGRGRYLLPGLAEMHGHLPGPRYTRQATENTLFLYVANGVTLLRGMQGHPQQLTLREEIASGEMIGPRLLVSSPPMSGRNVSSVSEARLLVKEASRAGYDHIKIHEGLSPEVYDAIAAKAKDLGIPFAGHVSNYVGLRHALRSGQHTIDHMDNYIEALVANRELVTTDDTLTPGELIEEINDSYIPYLVKDTVDAGAGVVPTMALWEHFFGAQENSELQQITPGLQYMPEQTVNSWIGRIARTGSSPSGKKIIALRRKILRALNDGGATILFGTDSPQLFSVPGFSIHKEMRIMVEAGMSPYEVLESATAKVASFYQAEGEFGRVAAGSRADLVLVKGNPLEDLENMQAPAGVMVNGRWLDENEIRRQLDKIAASYRR